MSGLKATTPKSPVETATFAIHTTYRSQMLEVSGTRRSDTSAHALCAHAQNVGVYIVVATLYSILQKDV